jgi:uncharacterized protein (TIGR02001 family)
MARPPRASKGRKAVPIAAPDAAPPDLAFHSTTAPVTVDAYAAIASQYVYRGIALRDRPTVSAAVTTNTTLGWFADVWTGLVDADAQDAYTTTHGTEWDIDASIGYGASLGADWQWSLAAARIIDVGDDNRPSENYTEWRANLFLRDTARAQFAYSPDYLQRGSSFWNAEIGALHALTDALSGEGGLGYSHGGGINDYDYAYGWVGLGAMWLHTQWDVRWVDTSGAHDPDHAGSRVVLSLSWGQHLR